MSIRPAPLRTSWMLAVATTCLVAACGGGGGGSGTAVVAGAGANSGTDTGTNNGSGNGSGSGSGNTSTGTIVVVGTATPLPAGATRVATLDDVAWSTLAPGTQVLLSPGTYPGILTIVSALGTQAAPIVLAPFDTTHPPVMADTVDIQHSAWLQVTGLTVQSPTYSGLIIRNASNHVTLSGNTIIDAPMGIDITDGAGTGNQILDNQISGSATNGIGIDVNAVASDRTVIAYNVVSDSGTHGMEINASHYRIEHNTVTRSGLATPGSSGIHVFSADAQEDSGDDNLIRYNASYANADPTSADGNGIEIDHWCDNNTVSFNLAWGNDGAGIIVYDASSNLVQSNTLYGNVLDPGHTHAEGGAELVIGVSSLDRSANNTVRDNLIVSTHAVTPALYLNGGALGKGNLVGPNLYYNTAAGGTVMRWGDQNTQQTASQINAATATLGNLVVMPAFANVSAPLSDGLRLTALPTGSLGVYLPSLSDLLGQSAISGWGFFGAYFTAP